jgi:hypothetical protein
LVLQAPLTLAVVLVVLGTLYHKGLLAEVEFVL